MVRRRADTNRFLSTIEGLRGTVSRYRSPGASRFSSATPLFFSPPPSRGWTNERIEERLSHRLSSRFLSISHCQISLEFIQKYYAYLRKKSQDRYSIPNVAEFLRVERDNFLRCGKRRKGRFKKKKKKRAARYGSTFLLSVSPFPILIWKTRFLDEGREKEKKRGGKNNGRIVK